MFRRKHLHRDMADVNVYTAGRLKSMAESLSGLARAFAGEVESGGRLGREDALAAMQSAAALVCGDCSRCNLYSDSGKEESYYLYYLLRTFEQKGKVGYEDMPRFFMESCRRREEYVGQLNRYLGRATMNLSWKNRFMESRDAVIVQFRELAQILEEFSCQMEQATDITESRENAIRAVFRRHHLRVENMLVLEYEHERREAFITARSAGSRCMTARDAAALVGKAMGSGLWAAARDSKNIITRNTATFRFVEEGKYRMLFGLAREQKEGEQVSGDSYTVREGQGRQVIMSISDGMGSGPEAAGDSRQVIELTEQLLETGFSGRAALKLVNTVLLLAGTEQRPATLDVCCVDLYSGVLESMKLGAAATFVVHGGSAKVLEAGQVPAGVLNPVEPLLMSEKLWDNDRVIMVSDGVLEALPGEDKEAVFKEYLESVPGGTPQEMADGILAFAESFEPEAGDDMTVLVGGVYQR